MKSILIFVLFPLLIGCGSSDSSDPLQPVVVVVEENGSLPVPDDPPVAPIDPPVDNVDTSNGSDEGDNSTTSDDERLLQTNTAYLCQVFNSEDMFIWIFSDGGELLDPLGMTVGIWQWVGADTIQVNPQPSNDPVLVVDRGDQLSLSNLNGDEFGSCQLATANDIQQAQQEAIDEQQVEDPPNVVNTAFFNDTSWICQSFAGRGGTQFVLELFAGGIGRSTDLLAGPLAMETALTWTATNDGVFVITGSQEDQYFFDQEPGFDISTVNLEPPGRQIFNGCNQSDDVTL